ncbi:hypothetical protein B0F87_101412 [Methylobacter tundripaludum]|uniref:Uncharacterized protein n=1 Tax=Methylobacter tundripaludum TaxID=173365 RepID=A0A2S6HKM3_9GAMM|nr:hypothetical protein B0F87_101412 [Methylobacter tundripaludum]
MMGAGYRGTKFKVQGERRKAKKPGPDGEYPLVPKLQLGNAVLEAPASRNIESWSFLNWVPKLELGNQRKYLLFPR